MDTNHERDPRDPCSGSYTEICSSERPKGMPLSTYLPHVVYATALTSIAVHLLSQRRGAEERRFQLEARIGILESIRNRLKAGEDVSDEEIARLRRMATEGTTSVSGGPSKAVRKREIGWKEVMFGGKPGEHTGSGHAEAEDVRLKKEWNDGEYFTHLCLVEGPFIS